VAGDRKEHLDSDRIEMFEAIRRKMNSKRCCR